LQGPLKLLAEALHSAISESEDVERALGEVRKEGFQPFLVLEITVGLSQRADEDGDDAIEIDAGEDESEANDAEAGEGAAPPSGDALPLEPGDRAFLRSIRIRVDE
jgi:hypothetical protein